MRRSGKTEAEARVLARASDVGDRNKPSLMVGLLLGLVLT
jgi:hypothetical protein